MSELQPGPAGDARVAEWMGWLWIDRQVMGWGDGPVVWATGEDPDETGTSPTRHNWQPTTNAAHAGEARRRAKWSRLTIHDDRVACNIDNRTEWAKFVETADAPDPKAAAEALATCRAIEAVLRAREKGGE